MKIIKSRKCLYVDIDETLVLWHNDSYHLNPVAVTIIKRFFKRKHTIIAWSAGGAEWAAQTIKQFKLQKYFDLVLGKPDWYLDDKEGSFFLTSENRIDPYKIL